MSSVQTILCSGPALRATCVAAIVLLSGCGQRGPLYLPTGPAAANRATLPQVLLPGGTPTQPTPASTTGTQPSPGTGTGTAAPVRTP